MSKEIVMSEEGAEQLWSEIENQGFGYWVMEYGYDGDEDPILKELGIKAKVAMVEFKEYIQAIWDNYEIG